MALNFTVSYTFSPNTTISSTQVNTNTSDVSNVFTGLEALTKTWAKIKVDVDPTTALEVATKQYVDHYSVWRRPVLKFGSVTTVSVESGLDGTSGDIPILFPDGTVRTETSTNRTTFDITRNAVLLTSGAQSGLTGATSEATNTWYALYAVKVTDSSTLWVTVGSTVLPIRANFSTLNTAYGSNGWVYLGMIRNGDNSGTTGDILNFYQSGNLTIFNNVITSGNTNANVAATGFRVATTNGAATLTYTTTNGTTNTDIPNHLTHILWFTANGAVAAGVIVRNAADAITYFINNSNTSIGMRQHWSPSAAGVQLSNGTGAVIDYDIGMHGFIDGVLGVGSNPIL
jgi:hypothetical protein